MGSGEREGEGEKRGGIGLSRLSKNETPIPDSCLHLMEFSVKMFYFHFTAE